MDSEEVFSSVSALPHRLMDPDEWLSLKEWTEVIDMISNYFDKSISTISYEICKYDYSSNFRLALMKILPLSYLQRKISDHIKTNINTNFKEVCFEYSLKENSGCFTTSVFDNSSHNKQVCDYNKGAVIGILDFKGYVNLKMVETECACKLGDTCKYEFKWDKRNSLLVSIKDFIKILLNDPDSNYINHKSMSVQPEDIENLFKED